MPPGPGLAAALHRLELGSVPNDRILDVLTAQYRQLCHDQARMIAAIAEVGRCEGDPFPLSPVTLFGAVVSAPASCACVM